MLDFLNEVLAIEDNEPEFVQMGISGKSGAKMKAPDGGKAGMKGDFNAMHPRYPKGHPQGGKFMPKGSKDQIQAIAKNTGQSVEKVAAAVGGKAPANKGKLGGKFMGSAGAVGKAQKVLKNKDATPEQRAKAKASIRKAAMKMRGEAPAIAEKPKRGRISNKELMAQNASGSSPASEKPKRGKISNKELMARNADKDMSKMSAAELFKESDRIMDKPIYKKAGKAPTGSMAPNASKKTIPMTREEKSDRYTGLLANAVDKASSGNKKAIKVATNVVNSQRTIQSIGKASGSNSAIAKSIARNAKKKAKR